MSITTTELMEGVKLHKIDTKKYKTNLLAIYLTSKLDRMHVTENALMLAILRRGTNKLKTQEDINIKLEENKNKQVVLLNGQDVSDEIRSNKVTKVVSQVSSIKEIREKLVEMQREMAKTKDIIMEGRDITTVVFPNADVKIYLDADLEERAKRRFEQNKKKNIESTYEQVLNDMKARDENDKNKEFGALKIAKDAIVIDSSKKSINEVVSEISKIVKKKKKES